MLSRWTLITCFSATLLSLGGCPFATDRLNNQGGGNLITLGLKAINGNLTSSTPDEWQVLTDRISELSPQVNITLGDDEAQAISDFLVANQLNSFDDVERVVRQVSDDPTNAGGLVIPESLQALIDSGIDLNQIVQVEG